MLCTYNKEVFLFSAYIQQNLMFLLDLWRQHFSMQNRCALNTKQTSPVFALAFKWKMFLAFSKLYLKGCKVCSKMIMHYHHLELKLIISTNILVFKNLCTNVGFKNFSWIRHYYFFLKFEAFRIFPKSASLNRLSFSRNSKLTLYQYCLVYLKL